jgi:hypothetical protein
VPAKKEPKVTLKEVSVQSSVGGKVQIVQYQYSQDFHFSMSQKYEVEGLDDPAEQDKFRQEKIKELRYQLEGIAQKEVDKLIELRDELRENG